MSHIIKVEVNKEGRYPIKLFGTDFEIEPIVKAKKTKETPETTEEK